MRRLLFVSTVLILAMAGVAPAQEAGEPEAPAEPAAGKLPPPLPPTPVVAQDAPNDQGQKIVVGWLPSVDAEDGLLPNVPLHSEYVPGASSRSAIRDIDVDRTVREWSEYLAWPIEKLLSETGDVLRPAFRSYLVHLTQHYLMTPVALAGTVPDASGWLRGFARDMGLSEDSLASLEPLAKLLDDPEELSKLVERKDDQFLQAWRTARPVLVRLGQREPLLAKLRSSSEVAARIQTLLTKTGTIVARDFLREAYSAALGHQRLLKLQAEALKKLRRDRPDLVPLIDAPRRQSVTEYVIERAPSPNGPWTLAGKSASAASSFEDGGPREPLDAGRLYFYRVTAVGNEGGRTSAAVVSATPKVQWWNYGRTNIFWWTGIFIALIVGWIWGAGKRFPKMAIIGISFVCGLLAIAAWVSYGTPFNLAVAGAFVPPLLTSFVAWLGMRTDKIYIRPIAGIQAVEEAIGRATEMGKPILYVPGLSTIEDIATLAALNILGPVAERAAEYDSRIIVPNRDPVVYTIAEEVVKESYLRAGRPDSFRADDIYFVTGRQFAFAAAVNGLMLREKPATNFFLGMFWAESLLLAETGAMTGAIQIAGTDAVTQLPFFIVACDYTLIGEELYAAGAYMGRDPKLLGGLKGQDYNKAIFLLSLVAAALIFFVADLAGTRTAFLDFTHDAFQALFQVKN